MADSNNIQARLEEARARAEFAKASIPEARARKSEADLARKQIEVTRARRKVPIYQKASFGKSIRTGLQGLGRAIVNPSIMSESQFYGSSPAGQQAGRGRGRPTGTYTYVIPGIGPVPIQAYKRWQSSQRAQQRVQNELMKARFDMQPSQNEMPQGYGQYSAEDAFAGAEDNSAMQQFQMQQAMAQQQAQQQVARPGMMQRFAGMFRPQQQMQQQGPAMVQRAPMGVGMGQSSSRMAVWNGGGLTVPKERNILNAPNVFNRQGGTTIGVARQQQY